MDFQGQRASERAAKVTLAIGAVVAYARGWLAGGDFGETMRAFAWSVAVACVVSVPPWNVYARNPVTWRSSTRVGGEAREEEGKSGDGKKTQKKKARESLGKSVGDAGEDETRGDVEECVAENSTSSSACVRAYVYVCD